MKKTIWNSMIIMVFMLAVSGCDKSSKNVEEMTEPIESMSETVEGVEKTLVEESKSEEPDKEETVEADAIDMELAADKDKEHTWLKVTMQEEGTTMNDNCDSVNLTEDEGTVHLIFEGGNLKNFKVLSLQMMDVTEDGTPIFNEETAYEYGEWKEGVPLIVGLTFYGDSPSWGFSYQDEEGKTCKGYLCLSGYDGSLIVETY